MDGLKNSDSSATSITHPGCNSFGDNRSTYKTKKGYHGVGVMDDCKITT